MSSARPQPNLAVASVLGIVATLLTGVTLEALTDHDWTVSGWEWPETVTTAVVLALALAWILPSVAPRAVVAATGPVRKLVEAELARRGYAITRIPPLAVAADHALELDFEYVLSHYLERRRDPRPFFFVQVGAFDGVTHDALHAHIRAGSWHGVLVEPQPAPFERLQEHHADSEALSFVNAAIDARERMRDLYRLVDERGEAIEALGHLASFSRHRLEHWQLYDRGRTPSRIERLVVPCVTFEALLRDVEYLDLLQLDAEGYDLELLRLFPFGRCSPPLVRFEHAHLSRAEWDESVRLLASRGYRVVREEYDTTAYSRRDRPDAVRRP